MSTATYKQRLQVLEAAVADLRSRQSVWEANRPAGPNEDLVSDVDQPLIPAVPPKERSRFRAELSCIRPGPRTLGLSEIELPESD
jgi:hypothetical protein